MPHEIKSLEIQVASRLPGVLKAGLFGIIAVGLYYSLDNLVSAAGYVLAGILLSLYILMEGTAVSYFNKFTLLKTLIDIKYMEINGTLPDGVSLNVHEEKDIDETSTK